MILALLSKTDADKLKQLINDNWFIINPVVFVLFFPVHI